MCVNQSLEEQSVLLHRGQAAHVTFGGYLTKFGKVCIVSNCQLLTFSSTIMLRRAHVDVEQG